MSAEDHVAALKELMGPDTVVVSKIGDFIERLLLTVALYREGIKKGDLPMERSGALQGFQAIVALVEQILSGVGVSEAHQEVLFEHIRTLHHSNQDLNFRLQHPRFLSPMPVDSRPPTIEAPEVGLRADLGAALHLLMRNRVNKKKAAADIETATGAPAASVIQWRRDGLTGPDQRIRGQFRTILELMAKHFPDDPARAAKELINSRSKNAGVS